MDVRFSRDDLERLEVEPGFDGGHSPGVVKAYRKRLQFIRSASDERAFYPLKSLHFEKLKGRRARAGDHAMKLNDQWRLILRFEEGDSGKTVLVFGIEDYH